MPAAARITVRPKNGDTYPNTTVFMGITPMPKIENTAAKGAPQVRPCTLTLKKIGSLRTLGPDGVDD
jgi:hypothetical protein